MHTRPTQAAPVTEFNFDPLKFFLLLTPPLHPVIEHNGAFFPSPIKAHLTLNHGISEEAFQKAAQIDEILRINHPNAQHIDTYETLITQIEIMMHSIKYHIDHFQEEKLSSLKVIQRVSVIHADGPTMIYFPISEYIKCYTAIYRCKLDTIDQYIKRQRNLINQEALLLSKVVPGMPADTTLLRALEEKLKAGYMAAETCMLDATAQLKTMKDEECKIVAARWKFQLYQRYVEILLFKSTTEKGLTRRNLKSLGTKHWLDLVEHYGKQVNSMDYDIEFLILRARHDQCIDNNLSHAKNSVTEAEKLFAQYRASNMASEKDIIHFTNHITVVKMSIVLETVEKTLRDTTLEILTEAINTIMESKDTIARGAERHRTELTIVLDMILGVTENKIRLEFAHPTLEKMESLLQLIELAKASLSFFDKVNPIIQYKEKHNHTLNILQNTAMSLIEFIKNRELANIEAAAELAKKEAQYELNFEKSMKTFAASTKSILKARKKTIEGFVRLSPVSANPPTTSANSTAIVVYEPTTPPNLVQRAREYFKKCDRLDAIEGFIKTLHENDDRAEALLYIGDKYYLSQVFDKALVMYEACINETNLAATPNQSLVEAIKLQLSCTKELIEKQIDYVNVSMNLLRKMREDFIVKLGQQLMAHDANTDDVITLNKEEAYQAAYERGYDEYIRIGQKNRALGKPLSEPAQHLQLQKGSLAFLKTALDLTTTLITRVSSKTSSENFPSLTSVTKNPSALFKGGKKERMPNYNKSIGKPVRKKKR